jgi:UDP-N-acetyl-D-galactosamine dehydrogenase
LGYEPKVILAGREVSEYMPIYVAEKTLMAINEVNKKINGSRVLVFGLAFKDNVNDTRNSKIKITIEHLKRFNVHVDAYEPLIEEGEAEAKFGVNNVVLEDIKCYDCVIFSRNHAKFDLISLDMLKGMMNERPIIIDVAYRYNEKVAEQHGFVYKRL